MRLLRTLAGSRPILVMLAASVLIASVCAIASVTTIGVFPPKLERRSFQHAGALTRVLVDLDQSGITDRSAEWPYFNGVITRADLLAHLMASDPGLQYIGKRAHLPPDQIGAIAPLSIGAAGPLSEPGSEARAREIYLAGKPYRLEIQARPSSPIIDIYAEAPSREQAEELANASIAGARDYLAAIASQTTIDPAEAAEGPPAKPVLRQLGPARGAVLTGGAGFEVAALAFMLSFAVALAALLAFARLRRRRAPRGLMSDALHASAAHPAPASRVTVTAARGGGVQALPGSVALLHPGGAVALRPTWKVFAPSRIATGDGNWPRTTRVLPWMLAAFIAMLWLVPFDSIELKIPSPIDLKVDRLLLPLIFGTWVLSLALGRRGGPRLRLTWIHAALGGFVGIAFLSVILDAASLNRTLEFDTAIKKLPLLLSFLSLFLIMASSIRREEVAAFVKFTLVVAVLCAIGMIWEDRLSYNLFFEWSHKLLPGVFQVNTEMSGYDTMGRRLVHGPTIHPLAAAGMLSMALPIAVVGLVHARDMRGRILYGLAGCILMLGVLGTQRKTGLVAPVTGILTLAYFRRRELLRLTPVAAVLVVALVIVAPGTAAPVINQFRPDSFNGADTVNDRASDYDALRPDVWSHLALGRGYGTYEPVGHRVVDSQLLGTILEIGLIGLAAFILLGASVVATARRTIHSRERPWSASALAGATASVVFLVLATLFDSLAFPQLPYIFMCFAALVAVVVKPTDDDYEPPTGS